ncbi:MAG: hypothetical protein OXP12_06650 [Thaumarchaeota archaeon]|nr:hypothetical protein [Nitrososphaerota archaeon]MDE0266865.1 hypothetical protein [Nitrososphaerota archaeon]
MGVVTRTNHGTEYLYFLVGKSQLFLGKKTDLEGLNRQNLERGMRTADATFDKTFAKYLESVHEHARYLPPERRAEYVKKRFHDLGAVLAEFGNKK